MPDDVELPGPGWGPRPLLNAPPLIAAERFTAPARSVGIVLRTRDRPLLLARALAGIVAQTHRDWRLHIVNDGGDPAVLDAVLAPHAPALDGRLDLLHRDAGPGLMAAALAGMRRVTADLVVLHDDDDRWEPEFLAATTAFLADPGHAGFVGVATDCTLIEEEIVDGAVRERWRCPWPHERGIVDLRRALVEAQLPPISMVFRRSALAATGGYDPGIRYAGDYEFLLRLLLVGEIGHIHRPLANYHLRARGAGTAYGNSVVEPVETRQEQWVMLRNAMLRGALAQRPEAVGLVAAVLAAIAEADGRSELRSLATEIATLREGQAAISADRAAAAAGQAADTAALRQEIAALATLRQEIVTLATRIERLDAGLAEAREVAGLHRRLLRPLRAAWRMALPARRVVARLRGRGDPLPRPRVTDLPLLGPWLKRRELVRRHLGFCGRLPELDPPRGFNAHVIHRILHDRDPRLRLVCDKLAARDLVRTALGEAALVPLLGVWEDPAAVPWEHLPLPFVMKPNHASGLFHFVTRPEQVVPSTLTALAAGWLARDHYDTAFEWGYRGMPRRLMVEPLLRGPDGGTPAESQVFCFGGRAAFVRIYTGGAVPEARTDNWFDPEGRRQPIELTTPPGTYALEPALARRLAAMAERVAAGFDHLRVDFFLTDDGVKVGELTAYNRAGMALWKTPEMDLWLGRLWDEGTARLRAERTGR